MALVPRDFLPQPKTMAQTIHSTTRQPTKTEHKSCLNPCLTHGLQHTIDRRRTSRHPLESTMPSFPFDKRNGDEALRHTHYRHRSTVVYERQAYSRLGPEGTHCKADESTKTRVRKWSSRKHTLMAVPDNGARESLGSVNAGRIITVI